MKYSKSEILKAIDVAIDSNDRSGFEWAATHPACTTEQLDLIASKKKVNLTTKIKISRHLNATQEICEKFSKTNSVELCFAIMGNEKFNFEFRKSWLRRNMITEYLRHYKRFNTVTKKYNPNYKWEDSYWCKIFRNKLGDMFPFFVEQVNNFEIVKDIIT